MTDINLSLFCIENLTEINEEERTKAIFSGGSRISRRGDVDLVGGGVDPRGGYVSKILHVKTKESGPEGGGRAGRAP